MKDIKLQESEFELADGGKGKIAMFMYTGKGDPVLALDEAVRLYVGLKGHMEFIDINMDNPWTRVIVSGVNKMKQMDFNPQVHSL